LKLSVLRNLVEEMVPCDAMASSHSPVRFFKDTSRYFSVK
jgi:hypothetical protein